MLLALAVGLVACHSRTVPQTSGASREFPSTLTPSAVVNASYPELVARGFRITRNDARRGLVIGKRVAAKAANSSFIDCLDGLGADDGNPSTGLLSTEVTIVVAAVPQASGSDVTIRSQVKASFVGLPEKTQPENNGGCASSGAMERRLLELLDR